MQGLIFGGQLEDLGLEFDPSLVSIRRSSGGHKIATFLRRHGYDIDVVDYVHRWSIEQLKAFIEYKVTDDCLFFGFGSTFFLNTPTVLELVKWLKERYPHIPLVAGSQNHSMMELQMDWYIYGYGENAILALLDHFKGGPEPIHSGRMINCYVNYKSFPQDDLTVSYRDDDFIQPREILLLEFARGCKFKCKFCSFPVLGVKGDYSRTAQSVYDEMLRNYDKWGTEHYIVLDETFNDSSEKIEKFASVIEKLPFTPKMTAYIRADLITTRKRDWDNLIKMGITSHFYGVESLNHKAAKSIGKGMDSGRIKEGLLEVDEYFRSAGHYKGHISLIAGLPHETIDSLRDTGKWLSSYWNQNSYHMNVLMIKDLEKNTETLNHNSEFDKNWFDYGYRRDIIPLDDIDWSKSRNPYYKTLYDYVRSTGYYLFWRNEHTNLQEVMRFCAEEFSDYQAKNLIDPFMYDKFFIDPEVQWSDFATKVHMERRTDHILNHIDNYIEKKLDQVFNVVADKQ